MAGKPDLGTILCLSLPMVKGRTQVWRSQGRQNTVCCLCKFLWLLGVPVGKRIQEKEEKGFTQIGKGGEGAPESTPTHNLPSPDDTGAEKVPSSFLDHLQDYTSILSLLSKNGTAPP